MKGISVPSEAATPYACTVVVTAMHRKGNMPLCVHRKALPVHAPVSRPLLLVSTYTAA